MWHPWIGESLDERRLLILGESAYDWKEGGKYFSPQPDHSQFIVRKAIEYWPGETRFQKMVSRALCSASNPSQDDVRTAWDRVAFTNYVPESVGFGRRARPSREQWELARDEWFSILETVKPKAVVVLGHVMWTKLPKADQHVSDGICVYDISNGTSVICRRTWHPSGGGSWRSISEAITSACMMESPLPTF